MPDRDLFHSANAPCRAAALALVQVWRGERETCHAEIARALRSILRAAEALPVLGRFREWLVSGQRDFVQDAEVGALLESWEHNRLSVLFVREWPRSPDTVVDGDALLRAALSAALQTFVVDAERGVLQHLRPAELEAARPLFKEAVAPVIDDAVAQLSSKPERKELSIRRWTRDGAIDPYADLSVPEDDDASD